MKTNERAAAEAAYKTALKAWNKAAAGQDEAAFLVADGNLDAARSAMCRAQANSPTASERYNDWRNAAFAWQN